MSDLPSAILSDGDEEVLLQEDDDEESGDEFVNEFEFGGLLVSIRSFVLIRHLK